MARLIGIGGLSGSGKSTSLKYLNPAETFILSVTPKQLAIPGFRKNYKKISFDKDKKLVGNYFSSHNYQQVSQILKLIDKTRPDIKIVAIDD